MGLFGSTQISVASTVRNMAGDVDGRLDYLKTVTLSSVLNGSASISDDIRSSMLKGPSMGLRSFYRWSLDNYNSVGLFSQKLIQETEIDTEVVATVLGGTLSASVKVMSCQSGPADYTFWSQQYMLANYPDLIETGWSANIDETTYQITITFEDKSTYTFSPMGFDKDGRYLYTTYLLSTGYAEGSLSIGSVVSVGSGAFPSVDGYDASSDTTVSVGVTLEEVTHTHVSYSDSRPDEDSTSSTTTVEYVNEGTAVFTKVTYVGGVYSSTDSVQDRVDIRNLISAYVITSSETTNTVEETIEGGVTKTITTTVNTQYVEQTNSYRDDQRFDTVTSWSGTQTHIYKYGSGVSEFDAFISQVDLTDDPEFLPIIPIRINNLYITEYGNDTLVAEAKKAMKKSVGGDIYKVMSTIDKSPSIADIDYAYAVFGVSLNVKDKACRKYIYRFLRNLIDYQTSSLEDVDAWKTAMDAYELTVTNWLAWKADQNDSESPLFGAVEPEIGTYPVLPQSTLRLVSSGDLNLNYNVEISWTTIFETEGTGLASSSAVKGDVWFEELNLTTNRDIIYSEILGGVATDPYTTGHYRLYWQYADDAWRALDITGLKHVNYIYSGKYVETSITDALNDVEESGFIIPLHYPTYKLMGLADATQMSTACTFLVFNSYVVKKTGLLGSIFFKILIIIAVIAVIVFMPQLAPTAAKAAFATGVALGLSGTLAVAVGAAVNILAGMVLAAVISEGAKAVFGARVGAIIAAAVQIGFVLGSGNISKLDFSTVATKLTEPGTILKITEAVASGFNAVLEDIIKDKQFELEAMTSSYNAAISNLNFLKEGSDIYSGLGFDAKELTDVLKHSAESSDSFLSRTLMTGSDIAEFSQYVLDNFAAIGISTELV